MNKSDPIIGIFTMFIWSYLFLWGIVLFGFWGGKPEGAWVKIERLNSNVNNIFGRTSNLENQQYQQNAILYDLTKPKEIKNRYIREGKWMRKNRE